MSRLALLDRIRERLEPGFHCSRPLVLLQSDDWGRVGVRDAEGLEELRRGGLNLGERPYDLYSMETAGDVLELVDCLRSVRDSTGASPSLEMNFLVANLDFAATTAAGFREIAIKPLADGLPGKWLRPGLLDAYREGSASRVLAPALHGSTHFCRPAVEAALLEQGERAQRLQTLWAAETPYIHWRMPWVGYEYWHPERPEQERFLTPAEQAQWIGWAVNSYRQVFDQEPVSACAPGYRANATTHRLWAQHGIRVAQSGTGRVRAPHRDANELLHTYRSIDFEPALQPDRQWEDAAREAGKWLERGLPFIISTHSINFQSTLAPNRQRTLPMLRNLLLALVKRYPDVLFVNSRQLHEIVNAGSYEAPGGRISVTVTRSRTGTGA